MFFTLIRRMCFTAVALAACELATAGTFVIKSGVSDWTSADSFTDESGAPVDAGPVAGDTVIIPADATVGVDAASRPTVAALGKIEPASAGSTLVLDLDEDLAVNFAMYHFEKTGQIRGQLVKKGTGKLTLANNQLLQSVALDGLRANYFADLDIRAGTVQLPSYATETTSDCFGKITIAADATLILSGTKGRTSCTELWGEGTITNAVPGKRARIGVGVAAVPPVPCVFAGRITGAIETYSSGLVSFTGTSNDYAANCNVFGNTNGFASGIVGIQKIGSRSETGSGGAGYYTQDGGGRFLYLGSGETAEKPFYFYSTAYPGIFDAGAVGGVTFQTTKKDYGVWAVHSSRTDKMTRVVITGSNTTACVFRNQFNSVFDADGNAVSSMYITKTGSGTYRFEDYADRRNAGPLAVKEGTVEFTSIAEKGEVCSLGLSTYLYRDWDNDPDCSDKTYTPHTDADKVDYAFLLGGGDPQVAPAVFSYVGSADATVTTRPIALGGDATLAVSGTGSLDFSGIKADSAGVKTLTLGGTGTKPNVVRGVEDGRGKTRLAKSGTAPWSLKGANSFTGGIEVKDGKWVIDNYDHYVWYKFVFQQNWWSADGDRHLGWGEGTATATVDMQFDELAMYDKDGVRQDLGMTYLGGGDGSDIVPGSCEIVDLNGRTLHTKTVVGGDNPADNLFDDDATTSADLILKMQGNQRAVLADDATWVSLMFRLKADAHPCTHFDILTCYGTAGRFASRSPRHFQIWGSTDGETWHSLSNVTDFAHCASDGRWDSDGGKFTAGAVRTLTPTRGFPLPTAPANAQLPLANPMPVKVDAGATLTIRGTALQANGLDVDCAKGVGMIDNVAFTADGTLTLTNVADPSSRIDVAIDWSKTTGSENLANWTVNVNGRVRRSCGIAVTETGLSVLPSGMSVIIR